jgi:hypothetical protein
VTRRGGKEGRIPNATASAVRYLNHLETVCQEEHLAMPGEIVRAIAAVRVWCRGTGRQYRNAPPRP